MTTLRIEGKADRTVMGHSNLFHGLILTTTTITIMIDDQESNMARLQNR